MITIVHIGYQYYALKKGANVAALLKVLQDAVPVRSCYSSEKPCRYRALHEAKESCRIEIMLVDEREVGPPNPEINDRGEPIEKPLRRGRLLSDSET